MAEILIIDDEEMITDLFQRKLSRQGHAVYTAGTLRDGFKELDRHNIDVVMLDVWLPDGNGLDSLGRIQASGSQPVVLIMTGAGDANGAELAINNGAWDYIEKGANLNNMILALSRALQYREQKRDSLPHKVLDRYGIVGNSIEIKSCLEKAAKAASTITNTLITGETGTGKELFARCIHRNSKRGEKNLVVVDCAAMPRNLVESLLFGHVKGAYTGAEKSQPGLVLQADGGTLFLDEVGELPLDLQKAFLRVLQERKFRPVGSAKEVSSDFRLIAATNRNLNDEIAKGRFREDLFFRLRTFHLEIPPLRNRLSDIKDLLFHHMKMICERYGIPTKGFSPEFLETMQSHDWPGNIRELIHTLDRAISAGLHDSVLYPQHLPTQLRVKKATASLATSGKLKKEQGKDSAAYDWGSQIPTYKSFRNTILEEAEPHYLEQLMKASNGRISEACRISGLSRSRLYELLKTYSLTDKA